jgi:single-stranded DNA-binding protein
MLNQLILTGNLGNDPEIYGGSDETRTRDLRRDRPAF